MFTNRIEIYPLSIRPPKCCIIADLNSCKTGQRASDSIHANFSTIDEEIVIIVVYDEMTKTSRFMMS